MKIPYRLTKISRNTSNKIAWFYREIYHRFYLQNNPQILCNSFQKSGTHLLAGIVSQLPTVQYYGRKAYWHYLLRSSIGEQPLITMADVFDKLDRCLPGEMYRGHIAAQPEIVQYLSEKHFKHIFIYRDLRDVVVSLMFWWQKRRESFDKWPHRYFAQLNSDDERLKFLITGFSEPLTIPGFPSFVDYPDIGSRFREFLPWLTHPGCLAVRFEDLVSRNNKEQVFRQIAKHIMTGVSEADLVNAVEKMEMGTDPDRSKTFRKGKAGGWRKHFSAEHKALFKNYAGDLLIDLGYEKDLEW